MPSNYTEFERRLVILSPLLVIGAGHATAQIAGVWLGAWAWVPLTVVFWALMLAFIRLFGGGRGYIAANWFNRPRGSWWWLALAVAVGFIPFAVFVMHWRLLAPVYVLLPWLIFALINPWLEESYWRGLLLTTIDWKPWLSLLYTSALYALSHPLMWGVNSYANREFVVLASTFVMGVCWTLIYWRTGSLRYAVFSHFLVDLFNLSVAIFLNLNVEHPIPQ